VLFKPPVDFPLRGRHPLGSNFTRWWGGPHGVTFALPERRRNFALDSYLLPSALRPIHPRSPHDFAYRANQKEPSSGELGPFSR
jgi:hypothetical protein